MSDDIKFGVASAMLVGECESCKEPATGELRTDDYEFELKCISCKDVFHYTVTDGTAMPLILEIEDIVKIKT